MSQTPCIALLYDVWNKSCADIFEVMLKQTSYGKFGLTRLIFDPDRPERSARSMSRFQAVFSIVGIPGRQDYAEHLEALLEAYQNAPSRPALAVISHSPELTRQAIDAWESVIPTRDELTQNVQLVDLREAVRLKYIIPVTELLMWNGELNQNQSASSFSLPSSHKLAMMGAIHLTHIQVA